MHVLDNVETIHSVDGSNVLGLMSTFPEQIQDAITLGNNIAISKEYGTNIHNIVFSGMGGSAIGADIIRCLLSHDMHVPIIVSRDYRLPYFVNENTLLIVSSYSGNTEETIFSLEEGVKRGAKIITITTGGTIGNRAKENSILLISIPKGFPPRQALAFSTFPILVVFEKIFSTIHVSHCFDEVVRILSDLRDQEMSPSRTINVNKAKQIADRIHTRFPIIYTYDEYFAPVALRWRNQLEENAKMLCSHHVFPEMNHNEIMGWQRWNTVLEKCIVLMLKDSKSNTRVNQRMNITSRLIRDMGIDVLEIFSKGNSILSRIMSLVYIADYVSLYCAILNRVNPILIDTIDYLKSELEKSSL